MRARLGAAGRGAVVGAYVAVFWLILPACLWALGLACDRALEWSAAPGWGGWVAATLGGGLLLWGIAELWRGGRGLPVSALPPPRFTARGPYRILRHPIYLGFDVAVFGVGLAVGSPSLAWIVAPGFGAVWVAYALVEERGLVRRFGHSYRRYQARVGLFPRPSWYPLVQAAMLTGVLPYRVEGRGHIPRRGPVVLVANHACYLDPFYVGMTTWRPVWFPSTAEAYRRGPMAWWMKRFDHIPIRRYRPDPVACREVMRRLSCGEVIGMFPESERTVHGGFLGVRRDVAGMLAQLPVPVVPIGVSGSYDVGPRWAAVFRRRRVQVRVGPPLEWGSGDPAVVLDAALRDLLEHPRQPIQLEGLPRERLRQVLWRCPHCLDESGWSVEELGCNACGARYLPTRDGWFERPDGVVVPLAGLAEPVWRASEEEALEVGAHGWTERSIFGPIGPLAPLGDGRLRVGPDGLHFGDLHLSCPAILTTTTERSDTLQVATADGMWQFQLVEGSPFRLQLALDRWRDARPPAPHRLPAPHVSAWIRPQPT